jgi:hypothetical protein
MSHEHSDNVGLAHGIESFTERHIRQRGEFLGQSVKIRIGEQDAIVTGASQLPRDRDRGALPRIVDVGLVG